MSAASKCLLLVSPSLRGRASKAEWHHTEAEYRLQPSHSTLTSNHGSQDTHRLLVSVDTDIDLEDDHTISVEDEGTPPSSES